MTGTRKRVRSINGTPVGPPPVAPSPAEEEQLALNILLQTMATDLINTLNKGNCPFHGFSPLQYPARSGYHRWYRKRYPNHFRWTDEDRLDETGLILPG